MSDPHVPVASASIVIVGVARNCAANLNTSLQALYRATAGFRERGLIVIESDSNDGTDKILESLTLAMPSHLESLGQLRRGIPARTERIAHCRNRIIEIVREKFGTIDYVLVADLDGVNDHLTARSLEDGWSRVEPWDVLSANQADEYYDVWALRHAFWSPNDCWLASRQLEPIFGRVRARQITVHSRQVKLPTGGSLVEVDSAFGGLAIYRRKAFLAASYAGTMDGQETCEHVPYHLALRKQGYRIFINPALVNRSQSEHVQSVALWKTLLWRIMGR